MIVPVGLSGLVTITARGTCARPSSSSTVSWNRVSGPQSISTTLAPSACRVFRYAGYPGRASTMSSPGSSAARNSVTNPPDDPVVTTTSSGATSRPAPPRAAIRRLWSSAIARLSSGMPVASV